MFRVVMYILLLLFVKTGIGQSYREFRNISVDDGLSQNSIVSISQDQEGYLWMATQDGLNRYNGRSFKYFKKYFTDVTQPSNFSLGKVYHFDQFGTFIIPLSGKIERYNEEKDEFEVFTSIENARHIVSMNDSLWAISSLNEGIVFIDPRSKNIVSKSVLKTSGSNDEIFSMIHTTEHGIIAGTKGGVWINAESNPKFISIGDEEHIVTSIIGDRHGGFWVGTFGSGVYKIDRFNKAQLLNGIEKASVMSLHYDSKDQLWIGTYGGGLKICDVATEEFEAYMPDPTDYTSINYRDILSIFEDYLGVIWIGTDGGGVDYYDPVMEKFDSYSSHQIPKSSTIEVVRSLTLDESKELWIGTSGEGLTRFNKESNTWITYVTGDEINLPSNRIMSLLTTEDQSIWLGTQGVGLHVLNPERTHCSELKLPGMLDETIWALDQFQKDVVLVGTRNHGLVQVQTNPLEVTAIDYSDSSEGISIRCIEKIDYNLALVGTEKEGVLLFNYSTGKLSKWEHSKDLEMPSIKCISKVDDDIVAVGGFGSGMAVIDCTSGDHIRFDRENGLPNDVVYGIKKDAYDNLWLSSNLGLTMVSGWKNLDYSEVELMNFTSDDGLQSNEFNTGASFQSDDGEIYFGGLNGFTVIPNKAIEFGNIEPKVVISDLKVNQESRKLSEEGLELKHKENSLSFEFNVMQFSIPSRNRFKYRLVGIDEGWIDAENRNFVSFVNLRPGEYQFELLASTYDGIWNKTPKTVEFVIRNPWYLTKLAIAFWFFLATAIFYLAYQFQRRRLNLKLALSFEKEQKEKLKELSDFKSKIITNISHEFKTPLTVIEGVADQIENQPKKKRLIRESAQRLLQMVNNMLNASSIEYGKETLNVEDHDVIRSIRYVVDSLKGQSRSKDIDLNYFSDLDSLMMAIDKEKFEQIVINLTSNAIKFTSNLGSVRLNSHIEGKDFVVSVKDTGIGISKLGQTRIFDRFYREDNNDYGDIEGSGLGLNLSKDWAEMMGGSLSVESQEGIGSVFTLRIPISNIESAQEYLEEKEGMKSELPTLLLVDDNPDILEYLQSILTQDYQIILARNGERAVELAKEQIPDIILADVMMPKKDGFEMCIDLKSEGITSHIPIVLLTAMGDKESKLKGIQSGAEAYIVKPFDKVELRSTLMMLLKNRKNVQSHYQFESNGETAAQDPFTLKLNALLDECYSDSDFNTIEMAHKMSLSRTQLYRKVKALSGVSPSDLIRRKRLSKAKEELNLTNKTISEIAYDCGFSDPSYFSRKFKDRYGVSPNETRK